MDVVNLFYSMFHNYIGSILFLLPILQILFIFPIFLLLLFSLSFTSRFSLYLYLTLPLTFINIQICPINIYILQYDVCVMLAAIKAALLKMVIIFIDILTLYIIVSDNYFCFFSKCYLILLIIISLSMHLYEFLYALMLVRRDMDLKGFSVLVILVRYRVRM